MFHHRSIDPSPRMVLVCKKPLKGRRQELGIQDHATINFKFLIRDTLGGDSSFVDNALLNMMSSYSCTN